MEEVTSLKTQNNQKLVNHAIEDLQQDFKPNLTLLNNIVYAIASIINPLAKKETTYCFKKTRRKLKMQKVI